jgi:transposase
VYSPGVSGIVTRASFSAFGVRVLTVCTRTLKKLHATLKLGENRPDRFGRIGRVLTTGKGSGMIWFVVLQVVSTLVELVRLECQSESEKDLEIVLLHRQLAIYERKRDRAPRLARSEKLALVVLATKLKAKTRRTIKAMGEVIRIVKPTTLFGWHRQLVRLKWTYRRRHPGGRPRTDREIKRLVVRLARENDWGFERIEGELLKLGYTVSHETVGTILERHGIPPAPERKPSPSWRHLMTHYKDQLLACDSVKHLTLLAKSSELPSDGTMG